MKNRRQFVIDNVAAWFLAPELAKRIEWLAQHEDRAYLPRVSKPRNKLYACSEYGGFYLSLNTPFELPLDTLAVSFPDRVITVGIHDAVDQLGEATSIRELFIDFQKHLFQAA